jgi:putative flippase GtrA
MSRHSGAENVGLHQDKLCKELIIAGRFGLVGCTATVIHMFVVWGLIERSSLYALNANFIAFLAAFCFSFLGNYYWTFRKPGQQRRALLRFFLISASAFAVNTFLLATLLSAEWLTPVASALSAATVIPVITFLASRLWGFRQQENSSSES